MAENTQSAQSAPDIETFQFTSTSLGSIDSSVNLFRGNVSLPLDIVRIAARGGLRVDVSALYQSDVRAQIDTWNASAPTGVLGLGWSFPLTEIIAVPTAGAATIADLQLFLSGPDGLNQLLLVGSTRTPTLTYAFSTRSHVFWRIRYFADDQRWEIVREDGNVWTYGRSAEGDEHGVAWAVARDGWLGSTSLPIGQQVPTRWLLVEQRNQWGDRVRYFYDADEIAISRSLSYTRASYLSRIVDPSGRELRFTYGEKMYMRPGDPSDAGAVREYIPAHLDDAGENPPAYQDRYETRYLQSLALGKPQGLVWSMHFGYELVNASRPPADGTLVKRYLTSLAQISATGAAAPAMRFEYEWSGDETKNRGALTCITYPAGGTGSYAYTEQSLLSADTIASVPSYGGTPRVWFGDDFAVITWYGNGNLQVTAYSWSGTWVSWSRSGTIGARIADGTLRVLTGSDFFGVYYVEGHELVLHLFRRDPVRFGVWLAHEEERMTLSGSDVPVSGVVGDTWLALVSRGLASAGAIAWTEDDKSDDWQRQPISAPGGGYVAAAGAGGWLVMCAYDEGREEARFQRWIADPVDGTLRSSTAWSTSFRVSFDTIEESIWQETFLGAGPTFVGATYAAGPQNTENQTLTVAVRVFQWNSDGDVRDQDGTLVSMQPVKVEAFAPTQVTDSMLGSNGAGARYDGETWKTFLVNPDLTDRTWQVGCNDNLVVAAFDDGTTSSALFDPASDPPTWRSFPLTPPSRGDANPPPVSLDDECMVIGRTVYVRGFQSEWQALADLPSDTVASSPRLAGPGLISFERGAGADLSARVALIRNGALMVPADQQVLDGHRVGVDKPGPGTNLVGSGMLAAYSSSESFDTASELLLVRVVGDSLARWQTDFAVTEARLDDGYVVGATRFTYDLDTATFDPYGLVPQYACVTALSGTGSPDDASGGSLQYRFYNGLPPKGEAWIDDDAAESYSALTGMLLSCRGMVGRNDASEASVYALNHWRAFDHDADGLVRGRWVRTVASTSVNELARITDVTSDAADREALDEGLVPQSIATALTSARYALGARVTVYAESPRQTWWIFDADNDRVIEVRESGGAFALSTGLTINQTFDYDRSNGLTSATSTVNIDTSGARQVSSQLTTYAASAKRADGELLYPELASQHLLTPVVQTTQQLDDHVLAVQVTTWRSGWSGAPGAWAAARSYQGLDGRVPFDFSAATPDPSLWLLTSEIDERGAGGTPIQSAGTNGVPQASMLDASGTLTVATFTNAVAAAGETSYCGFSPYEGDGGWQLDGQSPGPQRIEGDAHTGMWSLRVQPSQSLAREFTLTPRQVRYLFSFWWKTADGFADDSGTAGWTLRAGSQAPISLVLSEAAGWTYGHAILDTGGAPTLDVRIELVNGKTSAALWVDDLFFTPFVGGGQAYVYDPRSWQSVAMVGAPGQTTRSARDGLGSVIAQARGAQPTGIAVMGNSRSVNDDVFAPASPNSQLQLAAAARSSYDDFQDGDGWLAHWTPSGAWQQSPGLLLHPAAGAASLSLRDAPDWTRGAVLAALAPIAELTAPVAISFAGVAARWNPGPGADTSGWWEIVDAAGATLDGPLVPAPLFSLPARLVTALDTGSATPELREALASRGVLLSDDGVTVRSLAAKVRWLVIDTSCAQRYLVVAESDGLAVSRLTLSTRPWTLVCEERSIQLWLDGRPALSWLSPTSLSGVPRLSTSDPLALRYLVALGGVELTAQFSSGANKVVQVQQQDGATTFVSGMVNDGFGNPLVSTKTAAFAQTLPGYRAGFISGFDTNSWVLSGEVSSYYDGSGPERTNDGGYPYSGQRFEAAATARLIETGLPGQPFAIDPQSGDPHTQRTSYSANRDLLGWPNGSFAVTTTLGPDGQVSQTITDKLGRQIARTLASEPGDEPLESTQSARYDATTITFEALAPNAFRKGATADDWIDRQVMDLAGRLVSSSSNGKGAVTRTLYDRAGRMRFQQDGNGAAADPPYFVYAKYDALGRTVEQGWLAGEWDALAVHVDDPAWPPSPRSWRKRWTYDGDGSEPTSFGRVVRALTNNLDGDEPDVAQTFTYDLDGNTLVATLAVASFDGSVYRTRFDYDNAGRVRRIGYPDGATEVAYAYDGRGQLVTVGSPSQAEAYARFGYDANGALADQRVLQSPIGVSYNSPGWPEALAGTVFHEQLGYTQGGVDDRGFYDGTIASLASATTWEGAPPPLSQALGYGKAGFLTASLATAPSAAAPVVWEYDDNGNIESATGSVFRYRPGTNQLLAVDGASDQFDYDANGNVTRATTRHIQTLAYDRVRNLPLQARLDDGTLVTFYYDAFDQRVLKEVAVDGGLTRRLYVRNSAPLLEVVKTPDGHSSTTRYIQANGGPLVLGNDKGLYAILRDHGGSVRVICDATGAPVAAWNYEAFGDLHDCWGEDTITNYLYSGQELDRELGLYNFNLRLYDTALGRFMAPDPAGQYPSPYLYAANNPLLFSDPTGALSWQDWLAIGVTVSMAVIFSAATAFDDGVTAPEAVLTDEVAVDMMADPEDATATGERAIDDPLGRNARSATDAATRSRRGGGNLFQRSWNNFNLFGRATRSNAIEMVPLTSEASDDGLATMQPARAATSAPAAAPAAQAPASAGGNTLADWGRWAVNGTDRLLRYIAQPVTVPTSAVWNCATSYVSTTTATVIGGVLRLGVFTTSVGALAYLLWKGLDVAQNITIAKMEKSS